jgi:hypothetical protein
MFIEHALDELNFSSETKSDRLSGLAWHIRHKNVFESFSSQMESHKSWETSWPPRVGPENTKGGSITVLLTSCLTGLESAVFFCFYLQNKLVQTSQTRGQWYSDTSTFSIPWSVLQNSFYSSLAFRQSKLERLPLQALYLASRAGTITTGAPLQCPA